MSKTEKDLSARYYVAEASIWVLGCILVVSRFVGLAPDQVLPILNITPERSQDFPRIVAALLVGAFFYMIVEWKHSSSTAKRTNLNLARAIVTVLCACVSLWLSYPLVAQNTRFEEVSLAWYLGFIAIGLLLGTFVSILAFSALMIRNRHEAKRLELPRVPVATRAQFIAWFPFVILLIGAYYLLLYFSPPVIRTLAVPLITITYVIMLFSDFAFLCFARDENGNRIPYAKRIAQFKEIHDSHDYGYILSDHGEQAIQTLAIPLDSSPQDIQQAMQEKYSVRSSKEPTKFRAELLEDIQLQFYSKDGNSKNQDPKNCGVRIHKKRGRKGVIRVLFLPKDPSLKKRELKISSAAVERYAEEYISKCSDQTDMTFQKLIPHAMNQAIIDTMVEQSGPLLHRLVLSGQEDKIKELLKQHVDINEQAEAGWTALLYACAQGYPRIARMLLDSGANPDISNVNGITPLMYGVRYGNKHVCNILIEYGSQLDKQDVSGWTALIVASHVGHIEIVKLLLDAGADSTIKTREGKTALDFAYACRQGQIAKLLRNANKSI